jgi:hypothetical protein
MTRIAPALSIAALAMLALGADDPAPKPVGFKADVAPILVKKCLGCHDDRKAEGGLNMKTYALLRKGGENLAEAIVEPGDPDASHLIELVRPGGTPRMPYKQEPLSPAEIGTLERWVQGGARFDGPSESETLIASLVDPLENLPKVGLKAAVSAPVASAAFTPDGKLLAAAVGDEVLLFETAGGKLVGTLSGHPGPLTAVRITPDGKTLVAAGGRAGMFGAIAVWDLEAKTRRHDLRGHADQILTADLAPDGRTLATGSYDRLVKLWDIAVGKELRTLKEHTDAVYSVAFSPDGQSVASAGGDRTAKVWDTATGRRRVSLSDATAELYAVAFAPDNRTVLAGGVDRSIRAWKVEGEAATLVRTAFAHDAAVLRLVVTPDGKSLVSSGEDRMIKLWDLATLEPRASLKNQPDWPMALAVRPDGGAIAVGRYDGSLALVDPKSGEETVALRAAPTSEPKEPAKPELARNATLNPPGPRGAARGSTVKVALSGLGVGRAEAIRFPEPGITARLLPREKPDPNAIDAEITIDRAARVGVHTFLLRTPLGTTPAQTFAVSAHAEAPEAEPNDEAAKATTATLPATLLGAIDKAGDVDAFRFEAKAGQELVFETLARGLGSGLNGSLTLLDEAGKEVAESQVSADSLDPVLIARVEREGVYTLRIADRDLGGSGNHFYRIQAGPSPYFTAAFPLAVEAGSGSRSERIAVSGANLDGRLRAAVQVAHADAAPGTIVGLPLDFLDREALPLNDRKVVVAVGPQKVEAAENDEAGRAEPIDSPGGVSGRIESPGDVDHFAFAAKRGRKVVVEVFGRRLGTPIDPVVEILDEKGDRVPVAVLRPLEETAVQFRDHPSTGRNVRLTWPWDGFGVGDYLLVGRELTRMHELPRNPDDDSVFWGLGHPRNNTGERVAFLGTTPEHHPAGQPIYKVELHPPGATFPPGGVAPVTLHHRNDDGGPGFGKDSMLLFDPPADGTYLVRVEDVRGLGGDRFGYHLAVREARPDFVVSLRTENPNVPRGGAITVPVEVRRIDGYAGPVDVWLEGLPPGITATPARVEADQFVADLLLMADESAPAYPVENWVVKSRAVVGESPADAAEHTLDPGGPGGGWITVTPEPNLKVRFSPERVEIRPGERVEMKLSVERRNGFAGRVPIDVQNLPFGVRVLHIGLNGVLVTEKESERSIFLYAEPWVEPMERPFYAVARCEPAGTDDSSAPIMLMVLPTAAGAAPAGSAPGSTTTTAPSR